LHVWDVATGRELRCLRTDDDPVVSVAWSPAGDRIASGSRDRTVRIWEAQTGTQLRCLRGHEGGVYSLAWSAMGERIVSGSFDGSVRVWDADAGKQLRCMSGHESGVMNVAWSATGDRIVSRSDDGVVRVWESASGKCLEIIRGFGDVACIAAGLPWRALVRAQETVVVMTASGKPVARFPMALERLTTDPSGHTWAGQTENYLCLFNIEDFG
jgi:WD40 repeat protein